MLAAAAVALAAAASPPPLGAQARADAVPFLDVPYLPQSEALCGAAAIAMVMRFWGATGVYAETFADLVDPDAGGIRGADLLRALRSRGFSAVAVRGDAARVRQALADRRPPVLLVEDRPGRFHYIVVVAWHGGRVVLHDPARAPFRVADADSLVAAWSRSDFWMLLAQPDGSAAAAVTRANPEPHPAGAPPARTVCAGMVEEGVRLAGAGDLGAAQRLLEVASGTCPSDPAPWRELAGVHALRDQWPEAARDARHALTLDPDDRHAARILATGAFLQGDDAAALDAWNLVREPVVDIVDVRGLSRTRFGVAADALGLEPQTLLTGDDLQRGARRLDAVPAFAGSRVSYRPREDGRAQIVASVVERPLAPSGAVPLAAMGLRALTDREVAVAIASPTGGGELWSASWRWWERRPRIALSLAAPAPFGGVWALEAADDRQTYGDPGGEIAERRRTIALRAADWLTGATRWEASAGVERWKSGYSQAISAGVEHRAAAGRLRLTGAATAMTGAIRTWTLQSGIAWTSAAANEGASVVARAGFEAAGDGAPLALWPGAGTGQGRDALLRAHPLLDDGVIRRGAFGRRLFHAGVEWRRWTAPSVRLVRLAPAIFLDVARAGSVPGFADGRFHADLGAGLRLALPGSGTLRVDVARGLRDGQMALSAGWVR